MKTPKALIALLLALALAVPVPAQILTSLPNGWFGGRFNSANLILDAFIGGGGGAGGQTGGAGGGGGGGQCTLTSGINLARGTYPVVIGAVAASDSVGFSSSFDGITALGGGQGANDSTGATVKPNTGGESSHGVGPAVGTNKTGGTSDLINASGGGAGQNTDGAPGINTTGGDAGSGLTPFGGLFGTLCGGGGGAGSVTKGNGSSGGGDGASMGTGNGTNGTANSSGGGGGGFADIGLNAGSGAAGIAIIREPGTIQHATCTCTVSMSGGYVYYKFTTSNNFVY